MNRITDSTIGDARHLNDCSLFFRNNLRVLDSRDSGRFSTTFRMERRKEIQREMHLHGGDGLRLFGVPVLRHDHLSSSINRSILRPHIPSGCKSGQTILR